MYRFRVSEEGFQRRRDGCRLRQSYRLDRNVDSVRCHGRFHLSYMDDKTDKTDVGQQMAA